MGKSNIEVSIFVTDLAIGFFRHDLKQPDNPTLGHVKLESEVIVNGYIQDPVLFYKSMKSLYKQYKLKPKKIKLVLHEQNMLIREFVIEKSDLQKKTVETYLYNQLGKTLHFPFSEAVISHHVMAETEFQTSVVAFIADANLLQDYNDVFEKLGAREITYDLPSLAFLQLYADKTSSLLENNMLVTLYENMISIHIVEDRLPIFGMTEECDGVGDKLCEKVENFVERIANYYKYNLRKGKSTIKEILLVNLSDRLRQDDIIDKLKSALKDFSIEFIDFADKETILEDQEKICNVAYASNMTNNRLSELTLAFKIDRLTKSKFYANYLIVLAIAIFSLVSIVYIPYHIMLEDIAIEENVIANLEQQLDTLQAAIPIESSFTSKEKNFSNAYDFLSENETSPTTYIADLLSHVTDNLELASYRVNTSSKQIVMIIKGTSESELYEYVIGIYEDYGIMLGIDNQDRWITSQPARRFVSNFTIEVTIDYA